ncbi:MAG: hypothetical protein A2Z96_02035 [Spirochaetes bacterium GWB1_48_6]|nr:MAG: hypothetical protein A2Z96_02035 [Spirochaetes bacterium GWB1_48_6]
MSTVLKGYQRDYLTRNAHQLQPIVMVGRNGLSPEVIKAVDDALEQHELIKVKFQDFKDEKKDLAFQITQKIEATLVRIIGNIAIFYRYQPDPKERVLHLPK